jgi:homoserine O-succinyltransferase
MVVLHLDSPVSGHRSTAGSDPDARRTCALVNNMPDGAFVQTERQFIDLLDVGSAQQGLDVRLYTMAGVERGEDTARRIADRYTPMTDLFDHPPRLLIVTGANPVEPDLEDEAIWPEMVRLLTWARHAVPSVLLSCLAAHAALSVFDGLTRESLPEKCTGVFTQVVDDRDPLAAGLAASTVLPHSRVSTVPTELVRAAGYRIPLQSDDGGWSVATRRVADSDVVLVQAHPEYGPTSLLREYQRDVRRYVRRERDGLPVLPRHCSAPEDGERLEELQRRIAAGERDPAMVESFPVAEVEARAPWAWRTTAEQLYTNWLAAVPAGGR